MLGCTAWHDGISFDPPAYRSVYSVKLSDAEDMVRTLTAIKKDCEKADQRDGYAQSIGQYLLRQARALGCQSFVFEWCDWANKKHLASGASSIDYKVRTFQETVDIPATLAIVAS